MYCHAHKTATLTPTQHTVWGLSILRPWVSWLEHDCNRDQATTAQYLAISLTSNSHESHRKKVVFCLFDAFFDSPLGK